MENTSLRPTIQFIYVLYGLSLFTLISGIVAFILSKRYQKSAEDALDKEHLDYQIRVAVRTFWVGLIGLLTTWIGIGYFILLYNLIWFIYKEITGFLDYNANKSPVF